MEPKLDTSVPKGPLIAITLATLTGFATAVALTHYAFGALVLNPLTFAYAVTGALFGSLDLPQFKTRPLKKALLLASVILFLMTYLIPFETLLTCGAALCISGLIISAYHHMKELRDA